MILRFGDFTLDSETFSLHRSGEPVALQRRVFDLVRYLAEHADRLVTKDELIERVWGGVSVSEASLSQAVKHARRALGDDADDPAFILTMRGRGYRFGGPVTREETRPSTAAPAATPRARSEDLVGRSGALGTLERGLADALEGRGGMALVSGEPGIGKTRVLDEIGVIARALGARVLSARCHVGDEGAPILWPWIQILRAALAIDPEGVAALTRERAGALVGDVLPGAPVDRTIDPAAADLRARFQLFDAVVAWLGRTSAAAPMVLLFDDLHRADEPSLLLLRLLAGSIREHPLFAVAAHRPFAAGGLSREPSCRSIALEGLGEDDVARLIARGLSREPSPALVRAVHAQTGGNPFFLTQIVEVLAARAASPDEADLSALLGRSSAGDAIRAHLEILSPACRALLAAASVCGATFDLAPLAAALGRPAAEILPLLGEAEGAGLLSPDERRAARHRFVHTMVRDALYAAIALADRVRLHGRIGAALAAAEQAGGSPRLAEIAYHYLQAAPAGHAAEAASFAVRAAEEAAARGSHEDAARLYERALEALDLDLGPADPLRRVEVMLALGTAKFRAGDPARSREVFEQSGKIARSIGAGEKLADAALGYALEDERSTADRRRIAFLEEGLRAVAQGGDARRALLTGRLAVAQYFSAAREAREKLGREAVTSARTSGDPAALAFALRCLHFVLLAPDTAEERCAVSGELSSLAAELGDREGELSALCCRIGDRLELGGVADADADIAAHARLAAESGQPAQQWTALLHRAGRALMSGPVDRAAALVEEAAASIAGPPSGSLLTLLFLLRRGQARLDEIAPALEASVARAPDRALRRALLALTSIARGDAPAAARALAALAPVDLSGLRVDLEWLATVACVGELASLVGDAARAGLAHDALAPYAGRLVLAGPGLACFGPVSLYLGLTARAAGDRAAAERHLEAAFTESRAIGAAIFEVGAQQALAKLVRARSGPGDAARARVMEAEALAASRELGLASDRRSK